MLSLATVVVAAMFSAEHGGTVQVLIVHRVGHAALVARHRLQDDKIPVPARWAEEDEAVAAVEGNLAGKVMLGREEGGFGGEGGIKAEVPQEGRRPMELAVAAAEALGGEDAAPGFADGRGADEPGGLVRRKAEEDLLYELVQQDRRKAGEEILYDLVHQDRRHCGGGGGGVGGDEGLCEELGIENWKSWERGYSVQPA
jgi:hypothetical protein